MVDQIDKPDRTDTIEQNKIETIEKKARQVNRQKGRLDKIDTLQKIEKTDTVDKIDKIIQKDKIDKGTANRNDKYGR